MMRPSAKKGIAAAMLYLFSTTLSAGAYIFADEINGVDIVTHPNTYTGSGGTVTVRVCIDPSSPNATDMEYSVQNNVDAYNQLLPTMDNVKTGGNNNIPSGFIDFESVALHEVGHCLGMAHINAATESKLPSSKSNYTKATNGTDPDLDPDPDPDKGFDLDPGPDGVIGSNDDVRGNDKNLVWFRRSNNDPFTIDTVIDSTTYSRDTVKLPTGHSFAANADRAVSTLLSYPKTEAVMQQGTFYDEAQRTLGHDDVATLRYAASGIDELESGGRGQHNNAADNYSIVLENGGISSSTDCDISMSITSTAGLAFCEVGGQGIGPNHVRITTANIQFGQDFNWFFNSSNTAPILNTIGNQTLSEGNTLVIPISATDNPLNTLSFSTTGLPSFASFVDHDDGTATLTISPAIGDASLSTMTVTVSDDGAPALSDSENIDLDIAVLDSDGDGIGDYDEINIHGTLPGNPDSDGDFIYDGDEINYGSDPLDSLSWPNFADADIAPLGSPDGLINAADYLIAQRIVLGLITTTSLELAHGDIYPTGSPDGVINTSDLILILKLIEAAP